MRRWKRSYRNVWVRSYLATEQTVPWTFAELRALLWAAWHVSLWDSLNN